MESRRLQHFLAAFRHGSLGRAAAELHISQPGLSKSIRQLERELQVKLFDRTPLGLVPTVFGNPWQRTRVRCRPSWTAPIGRS